MIPKRLLFIGSDFPENEKHCPHWVGVKAGLGRLEKKLGLTWKFVSCRPTLNLQEVVDFAPDLIIYGLKDMIVNAQWRKEIRERCPSAAIVIWYGDLRNEKTGQVDADCREVDAMFVSNNAQGGYYKRKWMVPKVFFLPLACEPTPEPVIDPRFAFDFVFIGAQITGGAFYSRAKLIQQFRDDAKITYINSNDPETRARIYDAMPAIYSSSAFALDISHFTDVPGYTSIRYFEIPAMWGFALTKHFPGCEELYPPDTRAYFSTYEEALEKKAFYTTHQNEKKAMLARAHELSYQHTHDRRFERMFSLL